LILAFNDRLENLVGLDTLTTLTGDLVFLGSQQLQDMKGALALTTVGGNLVYGQLLRRDGQPFNPAEEVEDLKLKDITGELTSARTNLIHSAKVAVKRTYTILTPYILRFRCPSMPTSEVLFSSGSIDTVEANQMLSLKKRMKI
jgi:hypothetical protein